MQHWSWQHSASCMARHVHLASVFKPANLQQALQDAARAVLDEWLHSFPLCQLVNDLRSKPGEAAQAAGDGA